LKRANQLPNQRSKKLAVVDSTPFILVGMVATQIFSQNKLSTGLPNGTSIAPSKSKFDAGSPVSPLNNSTYLSFQSWPKAHGGLSVDSNLSIPYTNLKEKSSELAELLKLVDPKATATTKKDQLIVIFKDRIYLI
jgi:hypothetical protein